MRRHVLHCTGRVPGPDHLPKLPEGSKIQVDADILHSLPTLRILPSQQPLARHHTHFSARQCLLPTVWKRPGTIDAM